MDEETLNEVDPNTGETIEAPQETPRRKYSKKPLEETGARNHRQVKEYENQKRIYAALQSTGDPMKLKEIIGVKTVAEVYRTLDKLTIRREFHDALTRAGITFEFLIEGIKREAIGGDKSADRLKAYEMLLKTLGLDKYDDASTGSTSSWEERLLKAIEGHESALEEVVETVPPQDYSVEVPKIPVSVQGSKKVNSEIENSIINDYPKPKFDK